jgi:hypothetical protein
MREIGWCKPLHAVVKYDIEEDMIPAHYFAGALNEYL